MDELLTLPGSDEAAADAVRRRAADVLRPAGALARLDEVAAWLAAWQRTTRPFNQTWPAAGKSSTSGHSPPSLGLKPSRISAPVGLTFTTSATVLANRMCAPVTAMRGGRGRMSLPLSSVESSVTTCCTRLPTSGQDFVKFWPVPAGVRSRSWHRC